MNMGVLCISISILAFETVSIKIFSKDLSSISKILIFLMFFEVRNLIKKDA